ncbi:thioredoxin domain-containing protein [Frigoribacterium sp. CFBP9030]|uniref:thioredoxin domain-containing protein n=1 Tax=Frigoribacterium sp. CFBP9030 TaxID=3096537 RepID=UPI002A6A01E5|nr:DUF255 domain-containing protein [Frigoribacterium sp. CFBP9030]MDY0890364.1 DUF255 domain-containing protein [Frigoribacterium sp. CFBP9030]
MTNRLADAVSPYLRSHAENPVDWRPWGPEAFAEAARRDVPVLVSIGYSTCHWCHVMARESFSDPVLAAALNDRFVAIKVDREEHPDVDSSYLAAASAFTPSLGWPLTAFATPEGRVFYAGTYYPPTPVGEHPAFGQVLDAVTEAWRERRDEVEATGRAVQEALVGRAAPPAVVDGVVSPTAGPASIALPTTEALRSAAGRLVPFEDTEHGGLGGAPKFPTAPLQLALLTLGAGGDPAAAGLASRTLRAMAASPLRDAVEGGFFRYSTRHDWADPHYERMLYDNALLLTAYSRAAVLDRGAGSREAGAAGAAAGIGSREAAEGVAAFLLEWLRTARGGFGSAQDSESTIDGRRVEGGYYLLDAAGRARHEAPPVDDKVLTGWNGLAVAALAEAGWRLDHPEWIAAARGAADLLLAEHVTAEGRLLRASTSSGVSRASAALEDYGMLAEGLLQLALATGEPRYAVEARRLVDLCLDAGRGGGGGAGAAGADGPVFAAPGGGDPVLQAQGTALVTDPSEGAYPSGVASLATAAATLHRLTGEARYRTAAELALAPAAAAAVDSPSAYGTTFGLLADLAAGATQVVVVVPDAAAGTKVRALAARVRSEVAPGLVVAVVDDSSARAFAEAGFELFAGRRSTPGPTSETSLATAYVCRDFVCRLPVTDVASLDRELAQA